MSAQLTGRKLLREWYPERNEGPPEIPHYVRDQFGLQVGFGNLGLIEIASSSAKELWRTSRNDIQQEPVKELVP